MTCFPRFVLAAPLSLVLVAGCAEEPPADSVELRPQRGGVAVMGIPSEIDSWNEYLSRSARARSFHRRIFVPLAEESGDAREHPPAFIPRLAESWQASADGLSITFRLREARWSDGQPVTPDDVRYTWQAQTSPDVPWIGAASKAHLADVTVTDSRTVVFVFDRVYPDQLADAVEGGILPRHVFEGIPFDQWTTYDWSTVSVGSGPFVLERYEPGHQFVLRRNPEYFVKDAPLLDETVVRIVPDTNNLVAQLRSGELDFVEGISPRQAHELEGTPSVRLLAYDAPDIESLGWNGHRAPFDDAQVRRALTLAIDRVALVEDLMYGYGRVSRGPVLSSWWAANRRIEPWPYDPAEARRLLRSRGYAVLDEDGTRTPGEALEIELITNSNSSLRQAILVKIQEQLSRVGVAARVRPLEMRALGAQVMQGDYDAYLMGTVFSLPDLKSIFDSSSMPPRGANYTGYRSKEVDGLFEELERAPDWRSMKEPLDAIQERVHTDQPHTYLYEAKRIVAYRARLHGVEIPFPHDPLAGLDRFWVASP